MLSAIPCKTLVSVALLFAATGLAAPALADGGGDKPQLWRWEQRDLRQVSVSLHFEKAYLVPTFCDAKATLAAYLQMHYRYDIFEAAQPDIAQTPLPYSAIVVEFENRGGFLRATIRYLDDERKETASRNVLTQPLLKCSQLMQMISANIIVTNTQNTPKLPEVREPREEDEEDADKPCQTTSPRRVERLRPSKSASLLPRPVQTLPETAPLSIGAFLNVSSAYVAEDVSAGVGAQLRFRSFLAEIGYSGLYFENGNFIIHSFITTVADCPLWQSPIETCMLMRGAFGPTLSTKWEPGLRFSVRLTNDRSRFHAKISLDMIPHPTPGLRPLTLSASFSTNRPLL